MKLHQWVLIKINGKLKPRKITWINETEDSYVIELDKKHIEYIFKPCYLKVANTRKELENKGDEQDER